MDKNHIIALNGGKNRNSKKSSDKKASENETAKVLVEGEEFELESFVLSGEGVDGKRLLFSWNCSLDEMISYAKVIDIMVNKRIDEAMSE